jgi:hypothetical protein
MESTDPQAALARLYGATRRHREPVDDLDDAVDDEDEGEEIVA